MGKSKIKSPFYMTPPAAKRSAVALWLVESGRWFVRFNKGGAVATAWSLAGAALYMPEGGATEDAKKIAAKGYTVERVEIVAGGVTS